MKSRFIRVVSLTQLVGRSSSFNSISAAGDGHPESGLSNGAVSWQNPKKRAVGTSGACRRSWGWAMAAGGWPNYRQRRFRTPQPPPRLLLVWIIIIIYLLIYYFSPLCALRCISTALFKAFFSPLSFLSQRQQQQQQSAITWRETLDPPLSVGSYLQLEIGPKTLHQCPSPSYLLLPTFIKTSAFISSRVIQAWQIGHQMPPPFVAAVHLLLPYQDNGRWRVAASRDIHLQLACIRLPPQNFQQSTPAPRACLPRASLEWLSPMICAVPLYAIVLSTLLLKSELAKGRVDSSQH